MSSASKPFKGTIKITDQSGLRKLMRAARRGKIPAERMGIIQRAVKSAAKRSWGNAS